MTYGDLISPAIIDAVIDTVVRHRVSSMVEGAEERGKHGLEGRYQNSLFCVNDGMVALLDLQWLHVKFRTLVGLFDRVGLRNNVGKIVGVLFCPLQAAGTQSEVVYGQRMTGEGPSYREQKKGRVQCKA